MVNCSDWFLGLHEIIIAADNDEAGRALKAAFKKLEQQVLNGTDADNDGYEGLKDALPFGNAYTLDATGSTATTASSIYLLKTGIDDVVSIVGNQGTLTMGDTTVQRVEDGSGKHYSAYYTPIEGYFGLQVGGVKSAARICNVTAQAGHTCTDDLIYSGLKLFSEIQPNMIVMSPRSLEQLRASRTATNATGAPAPRPTEIEGIPIIVSTSVGITDAIESGS